MSEWSRYVQFDRVLTYIDYVAHPELNMFLWQLSSRVSVLVFCSGLLPALSLSPFLLDFTELI
jgi:hypothetical protein